MSRSLGKNEKKDGWYVKKTYPHFDMPLPFEAAQRLVTDPAQVASFAFYPFISYKKSARRYRGHDNRTVKTRPIKYAAHKDGYIYSYYARELSFKYEDRVHILSLDENVIGYRKNKGNNVDFARAAFQEIDRRGECIAIALDISGFFDSIDHSKLKEEWMGTIGLSTLPPDHFSIFKALTRWAEVDRDKCYERLKIDTKSSPSPLCDHQTFRSLIKGRGNDLASLVVCNSETYGIPQGTAMSALLSNIYMIPFDVGMKHLADQIGGYYRRYSDDVLWICNVSDKQLVLDTVDKLLTERGDHLFRKDEKTDICVFSKDKDGNLTTPQPFQYLGFTYDGKRRLLRPQTLAKYWRRLIYATRGVKRSARSAEREGGNAKPFRKKIYNDLTHLGKRNFVRTYAYPASKKMEDESIRLQLKGHKQRIDKEIVKDTRKAKRLRPFQT